jgi:hypothetical protein
MMADGKVIREGNFFDVPSGSSYGTLRVGDAVFGSVQGTIFFFSLLVRVNGNQVTGNFRCALNLLQVSASEPDPEPEPNPSDPDYLTAHYSDGTVKKYVPE